MKHCYEFENVICEIFNLLKQRVAFSWRMNRASETRPPFVLISIVFLYFPLRDFFKALTIVGEMAQQFRAMAVLLAGSCFNFQHVHGWLLTTVWNSSSKKSNTLFEPSWAPGMYRHMCRQNKQTRKKAKVSVMHLISQSNLLECSLFRFQFWEYQN